MFTKKNSSNDPIREFSFFLLQQVVVVVVVRVALGLESNRTELLKCQFVRAKSRMFNSGVIDLPHQFWVDPGPDFIPI